MSYDGGQQLVALGPNQAPYVLPSASNCYAHRLVVAVNEKQVARPFWEVEHGGDTPDVRSLLHTSLAK